MADEHDAPWHVEAGANSHVFDGMVLTATRECVAFVDYGTTRARLIAAAPELLAALEAFTVHYPMGINPYLDDAYRAALDALRNCTA